MFSNQKISISHARKILEKYLKDYPKQNLKADFEKLFSTKNSITSRQNFYGHITASAIILDQTLTKVLLIEHKKLEKLIQPGGHVDETDETFFLAAKREAIEEIGFDDLFSLNTFSKKDIPIDIDIHIIPENTKKSEPEHLHFDFRYLFIQNSSRQGKIAKDEIDGYKFIPIEELFSKDPSLSRVARKVVDLVTKKRDFIFFERITKDYDLSNCHLIAVQHIVPDILPFLSILRDKFGALTVIPKPNSISKSVVSKMSDFNINSISKDNLQESDILNSIFSKNLKNIVIDTGGYFATENFFKFCRENNNIIGVIEDTENGLQKYKKIPDRLKTIPVISVARSELKDNEDDLVGYSIAFYTEMVTRQYHLLPKYTKNGILGYGKIGKGISKYLFNQNCKPLVYDKNPIKLVSAMKDGCVPIKKEELLSQANIIFSATGSKAITVNDLEKIQSGTFIVLVTSSDDELGFKSNLNDDKISVIKKDEFVSEILFDSKSIYLVNHGNAVNFIIDGSDRVGDFIRLIQGEIILGINEIVSNYNFKQKEIPQEQKEKIAEVFLEIYVKH